MTPPTILLVEDADADAETVQRALGRCLPGARVRWVRTAREALAVLHDGTPPPDLLLADLSLPDATGLALLSEVRRGRGTATLPVVLLTGTAHQSEVDAAYAGGAQGFFVKPLAPSDTERVLGRVCDYWFRAVRRPGPDGSRR